VYVDFNIDKFVVLDFDALESLASSPGFNLDMKLDERQPSVKESRSPNDVSDICHLIIGFSFFDRQNYKAPTLVAALRGLRDCSIAIDERGIPENGSYLLRKMSRIVSEMLIATLLVQDGEARVLEHKEQLAIVTALPKVMFVSGLAKRLRDCKDVGEEWYVKRLSHFKRMESLSNSLNFMLE